MKLRSLVYMSRVPSCDWRKIRVAPDLPERNQCVIQGVSVQYCELQMFCNGNKVKVYPVFVEVTSALDL